MTLRGNFQFGNGLPLMKFSSLPCNKGRVRARAGSGILLQRSNVFVGVAFIFIITFSL